LIAIFKNAEYAIPIHFNTKKKKTDWHIAMCCVDGAARDDITMAAYSNLQKKKKM
jgi:hypothetical protein